MARYVLTGAEVLREDGLCSASIAVDGVRIAQASAGRRIDLSGFRILPGIVDIHGDGFERHVAPRRGAMKDIREGLRACETEIAANGITTAVLAQFYSWEGGIRGPDFAARLFEGLRDVRGDLVTDLRGQIRLEVNLPDAFGALACQLESWDVDYLVFNDRLPVKQLAAGRSPPGLNGQALRAGRSPSAHHALLVELFARRDQLPDALDRLCAELLAKGITIGSHDDTCGQQRRDWRARGARISEFPETLDAAETARADGDRIVLGAPNVMRGGSHRGNASALDLITLGLCDALASDYHYPSLRRAALFVAKAGLRSLARAWDLVSAGPAEMLGLTDRGRLEPGLRADIVVMDGMGRVAATIAGGRFSHVGAEVATRLMQARG